MVIHRRQVAAVALVALVAVAGALLAWGADPDGVTSTSGDPAREASSEGAAPEAVPLSRAARLGLPGTALLPDMRSDRAFDLGIEGSGSDRRLRFAASLANDGPGPMLIKPRGPQGCPAGQQRVRQVVQLDANDNGTFQRRRDGERVSRPSACMLRHPTHDHWHFDAMASYTLRVAVTGEVLARRRKVSFCLRDNERVPDAVAPTPQSWFGECSATTRQGISPGWADVYGAELDGQSLPLPAAADRQSLCLVLRADPLDRLLEADERNNATAVTLRVRGDRVRRGRPSRCR